MSFRPLCVHTQASPDPQDIYTYSMCEHTHAHTAEMDDNILSKERNDGVSYELQGSRAMCLMRHSGKGWKASK